ncbi:hypothetical protein HOLleu_16224 [Holothuria leucospilota]|uniref:Uncharacterized protein n=1 Tax=Holothuria leucospilota TaxID=206669 RepID=A0A9Q1C6D2_HOLLE|nr:hypothetical protein HOLleu_16224 [Holothuria leucospilota]
MAAMLLFRGFLMCFLVVTSAEDCVRVENATCTNQSPFVLDERPCYTCNCDIDGSGYTCCPNTETPKVRYPNRCNLVLDETSCEYTYHPYPSCFIRACDIVE